MIEIDLRIVLDFGDKDLVADGVSLEALAEQVRHAVDKTEFAKRLWNIAVFHDCFVSKVRTADGVAYRDKFSYVKNN